jgi:hypothetical protein
MKPLSSALLVCALAVPALHGTAFAQDRDMRHDPDAAVYREEGLESYANAQREAQAARAQAERACRHERQHDRDQCMRAAREDYERQLAAYPHRHHAESR